jgi:hypothetical protein
MTIGWPLILTACADCGIGTATLGEWYMVKDEVWEQAWGGRRKSWHGRVPGQEVLCIGCLEARIGRTLMACDFTDASVNDPHENNISERLRDRLQRTEGTIHGADALFDMMAAGMLKALPPDKREKAWQAWQRTKA